LLHGEHTVSPLTRLFSSAATLHPFLPFKNKPLHINHMGTKADSDLHHKGCLQITFVEVDGIFATVDGDEGETSSL
jgi:hypothetical protein